MSKQFLGVIVAIILVFVGIFALSGGKSGDSGSNSGSKNTKQLTNHVEGKGTTGVKLVEYGDFQCPYCQQYESTVSQVVQEYGDKITFQFRNFPLTSLHPNAFAAARAAEAADQQGKYWEMHDLLYQTSNWQVWTNSKAPSSLFDGYAKQLGLNVGQFQKDFISDKVNNLINADLGEGNKLGITGTPSFFVDGKKVTIGNDASAFKKVLDAAIAQKSPKQNQ